MPRRASKFAAAGFVGCLLLLAVVFALTTLSLAPPAPLGLHAPENSFSAARARAELIRLLGDEAPHPVGSPANHLVESRLIARLNELGLTPQVQDTFVCSAQAPVCGHVQNVLARIDGQHKSAVLLMAHYDSVADAPGAGDDGAGVATLLEIARILHTAPRISNSIVFAFTDGEEPGMLGAEAFFSQHPWSKDVAVTINLEGSGSEGPVLLLRSGPRSGRVLDAFRSVARYPVASSFFEELFKHLPNNTDLSVSDRFGKPGLDFVFAGQRNHYHTPLDTIANLSAATLQHHGEDVLPLVRALARADLSKTTPSYVYTTLSQSVWLCYAPRTGLLISIFVVAGLGLATWRRWQGSGRFSAAFGIVALTFVFVLVLELALLELATLLASTRVAWPANPWPWRLIIYATPIVAVVLQRPLVRRVGFWNTLLAAWWSWSLLALALARFLPLASHLLLPAVVVATVVIIVLAFAHPLDRPAIRCSAAILNALVAGFFTLPLAYMAEVTQGLTAAAVMFVPLALLAVTLLPLIDRGRVKLARRLAVLTLAIGLIWAHWAPLYSEQLPQHVNFTYALDADSGQAHYLAWSPNPLPPNVAHVLPFKYAASPLPWDRGKSFGNVFVAPTAAQPRATTDVVQTVHGVTHVLQLRPAATTNAIDLALPSDAAISAIRVDGHPVVTGSTAKSGYRMVRIVAPPASGVTVEIDATPAPIDAYVIDSSNSLPDSAHALTQARGGLAVPVNQGDRWVVYRRLTI